MSDSIPAGFEPFPVNKGFAVHVGPLYFKQTETAGILGFRVMPHHLNPVGNCHGGMMMTVMDMALGFNTRMAAGNESFPPSIQLAYDFLQPAELGDWLESDVTFTHTTRRMGFADGFLIGPRGPVMRCNGICKLPRDDDPRFGVAARQTPLPG